MKIEAAAFTDQELKLISDAGLIKTKVEASRKIRAVLEQAQLAIREHLAQRGTPLPEAARKIRGKISVGENYRQLPYQVLDFPRFFDKQGIFAFRNMFWWGNFFSHTLHLSGQFLKPGLQKQLISHLRKTTEGIFFCINEDAWEYHYGSDNYLAMRSISQKDMERQLANHHFIKLSAKTPLDQWKDVPGNAVRYLAIFLEMTGY